MYRNLAEDGVSALRQTDEPFAAPLEVIAAVSAAEIVAPTPGFMAERYALPSIVAAPIAGAAPVPMALAWVRDPPAVRAFVETLLAAGIGAANGGASETYWKQPAVPG